MRKAFVDLTGQVFGRLTVLSGATGGWLCVCVCGTSKVIAAQSLKRGATRSCGCLNSETTRRRNLERNPTSCVPQNKLTGQRFGRLTVGAYESRSLTGKSGWICKCDCGGTTKVSTANLKRGIVGACGCLRRGTQKPKLLRGKRFAAAVPLHPRAHDLSDQRFGKLTAVHFTGNAKWFCACDCGGSTVAFAGNLRNGVSTSCGCQLREILVRRNKSPRARSGYRRVDVMKSGLRIDATLWSIVCQAWGGRCAYCPKVTTALTQDHVLPISKGGAHTIGNIAPACRSCNVRKLNADLEEALKRLGTVNFHARRLSAIVKIEEMLHA